MESIPPPLLGKKIDYASITQRIKACDPIGVWQKILTIYILLTHPINNTKRHTPSLT